MTEGHYQHRGIDLLTIWTETLDVLHLHDVDGQCWQSIGDHYREEHRHYHNLDHIATCLDLLATTEADTPPLRLALIYHDVIYETQRNDNEEASALYAQKDLVALGAPSSFVGEVSALILCTDHSGQHPRQLHSDLLCDIDLSTLGADEEEYDRYAHNIRREYEWVPDDKYRAGRSKVLATFLQRPWIYATVKFRSRFEESARANLERESGRLA